MGRKDRVKSGMIWTIFGYLVNAIYGFISVPILINYFGKSDYGLIGLAMSVNVYLSLMDMGLSSTSIRYFSNWIAKGEKESVNKLFQTNLAFYGLVGLVNAAILIVVASFGDYIFNIEPSQAPVLRNLMYILALNAIISWYTSSFNQLIQGDEYVGWSQKISLFPRIAQLLILYLTVTIHFSIELYYLLTVFSIAVVTVPLMVGKIKRICPYVNFIPRFDKRVFYEIFPYCISYLSINIFQFSAQNLRPIFLGMRSPVETVTDYRIIYAITSVVAMIGTVFYNALFPTVSKAVANKEEVFINKVIYQGTLYVTMFLGFCNFGLMSVTPELLDVYVGDAFLFLVPWLDMYLISNLGAHNQAISSVIFSETKFKSITYFTIVSCFASLFVCWFMIPYYQVGGVVFSVITYCVLQLGFLYFYYWPVKMGINSSKIFFRYVMPVVLIGAIITIAVRSIHILNNLYFEILLKGGLFAILYVIFMWALVSKSDRNELLKFVKPKNN